MNVITLNTAANSAKRKPAAFSSCVYRADMFFAAKQRDSLKAREYFTHQLRTHHTYFAEYSKQFHTDFLDVYTFLSANDGEFTVTHQYTCDCSGDIIESTWYAEVEGVEWDFATRVEVADFLDNGEWR